VQDNIANVIQTNAGSELLKPIISELDIYKWIVIVPSSRFLMGFLQMNDTECPSSDLLGRRAEIPHV
jgi:hypothetical protein